MAVGTFSAIIHKEIDLYVAECPEVGTFKSDQRNPSAVFHSSGSVPLAIREIPSQTIQSKRIGDTPQERQHTAEDLAQDNIDNPDRLVRITKQDAASVVVA